MTPGRRGAVVLALVATAALAAFGLGTAKERQKWQGWTFESVAWEAKGDRK